MRRFTHTRTLLGTLAASTLALGVTVAPAYAQDGESTDAAETTESTDASESGESGDSATPAKPAETPAVKGPFPRISDADETIYAVQRKAFLVDSKWELTPLFAASFSDRFVQTFAPAASVVYHLSESFGLEAYGAFMFPNESALTDDILNKFSLRSDTAKLTQMLWTAGVGAQWSPIYGKLEIMGEYLGNFSFYLGFGVGVGQTRVQCDNQNALDPNRGFPTNSAGAVVCNPDMVDDPTEPLPDGVTPIYYEPNTFRVMGAVSGGVRFHFSTWLALKFEVKDYLFVARVYRPDAGRDSLSDAVRSNIFAQFGVSFLLGGDED